MAISEFAALRFRPLAGRACRLHISLLTEMVGDDDAGVRAEIARALGEVVDPVASDLIVQLLYDRDLRVVQAAIAAVSRRVERDGPNPLYATIGTVDRG